MLGHPDAQFAEALASVFREAREKLGLSQKKLSELSGVGRTGIVTMEAGRRIPSMFLCKLLADGMQIPLSVLVAQVEKRLPKSKK